MTRYAMLSAILIFASGLAAQSVPTTPATAPSPDAFPLYEKAAKRVLENDRHGIISPSRSSSEFSSYPPFGDAWLKMETADYAANADVREMVRRASALNRADWPPIVYPASETDKNAYYLGDCRDVALDLRDAALYQSLVLNDQPAAFQTLGDIQHLAELLQNQPDSALAQDLEAGGIFALNGNASNIIVSGAVLTDDAADHHDLPVAKARQWIHRLLDHPDAQAECDTATDGEFRLVQQQKPEYRTKAQYLASPAAPDLRFLLEMIRRAQAERDLTAMSLAAHVYRFKHGRWPASLHELATELPKTPTDPFGNGKQTLGYVLFPKGLPDRGDRPLVYSRCQSQDGLFYRLDQPEYGYYVSYDLPVKQVRKYGGQFRDVARWVPPSKKPATGPTTRPLPPRS